MVSKRSHNVVFALLATLLFSHNIVVPVISSTTTFEDNKNYYLPDPSVGTPPSSGSLSPPQTTPSTPSHGSGHGSSSSSHGTPSHGGSNCSPPPSHSGGGGYYNAPPSSTPTPTTPTDPGTPSIPSPPFLPTPSPFSGGTCNFWSNHPGLIWGVLGWWGNLGNAFGMTSGVPGISSGITLPQALSNTRKDGIGALLREGTASYLNSLVNHKFPYTTSQVRDMFVASVTSNKAAAAQAQLFKMANEGRMKPNF
ncbi:hypothetical protein PIB30_093499 [Stylosanthes scabra]|uniref:Protodermal factor 1 n=1 Tax=Stylosanthes scabra TaxID=79078 RepID=A0ABU6SVK5_9FABA|nr:hypothetical protein [Stylosanthes scabra]